MGKKYSQVEPVGRVRISKRADSGIWYVNYKCPTRRRWREKSLETRLKKEAKVVAEHFSYELMNGTLGIVDDSIPLRLLFEKFFAAKETTLKPNSKKRLRSTVNVFVKWLDDSEYEVEAVAQLSPEIIRSFQAGRVADGTARRTVNNDIKNLHDVFQWAVRDAKLKKSPADYSKKSGGVSLLKIPPKQADTYTRSEVQKLLEVARAKGKDLIHDMILVFSLTGMRFAELQHLDSDSLVWDATVPFIKIGAKGEWTPKDPEEVKIVPMFPEVEAVLRRREAMCNGGVLFQNSRGNMVHESHHRARLKALFQDALELNGRRLHWHSFRNYFVKNAVLSGLPISVIMKITGHDTASMALHYAGIENEEVLSEAVKVFGSWGKYGEV